MSDKSKIEWTDATWNPIRGCTKVSAGCAHCYAETFAERFRGVAGHPYFFKQWGGVRKGAAGRELDGRTYDAMPATSPNPIASAGERMERLRRAAASR